MTRDEAKQLFHDYLNARYMNDLHKATGVEQKIIGAMLHPELQPVIPDKPGRYRMVVDVELVEYIDGLWIETMDVDVHMSAFTELGAKFFPIEED